MQFASQKQLSACLCFGRSLGKQGAASIGRALFGKVFSNVFCLSWALWELRQQTSVPSLLMANPSPSALLALDFWIPVGGAI